MFCMKCSWITYHFDSFISRFCRIKFSSTNSPRINRIPPWSFSIRMSTPISTGCLPRGLFFGHEPIRCPSFTPQKLHPLWIQVNTPISNPFFSFVTVLPRLEAWSGTGSPDKTLIPRYSYMKRHNSPIASIFWADSKP